MLLSNDNGRFKGFLKIPGAGAFIILQCSRLVILEFLDLCMLTLIFYNLIVITGVLYIDMRILCGRELLYL